MGLNHQDSFTRLAISGRPDVEDSRVLFTDRFSRRADVYAVTAAEFLGTQSHNNVDVALCGGCLYSLPSLGEFPTSCLVIFACTRDR